MGKEAIEGLVTVATAIVGIAIIATLVSKNANTSQVLQAGGNALGQAITAATGPVTTSNSSGLVGLSSTGWTGSAPIDTISI